MTLLHRHGARFAAALFPIVTLSACAFWTAAEAPPRTSISISAPSSIQRPEWLQREVARMDAEAFPAAGALTLKLSYELSPVSPAAVAGMAMRSIRKRA
ncbi:hypothetical protein FN976_27875 [Caenimonas sedimenti]|uniref:Uncharacterized protein n=1 Tax=Caenimonas sedimenti TaxID=2596921 RepID=A0A562ZDW9_9BURK|nr:hypothetical protein [Caenimonas sedimenti]TWO64923.1 hypothetical protein FN976_27875 [Caenimonas sedimenti]